MLLERPFLTKLQGIDPFKPKHFLKQDLLNSYLYAMASHL